MIEKIGYPDWIKNDTALKEYYHGFNITETHYANRVAYFKFDYKESLALLGKPIDKNVFVQLIFPFPFLQNQFVIVLF